MTKIITYKISNGEIGDDHAFLAYIVLANGKFDTVRFNGATEEIARARALAFVEKEQREVNGELSHHLVGKAWMKTPEGRLVRIDGNLVDEYLEMGYVKSGPRSK